MKRLLFALLTLSFVISSCGNLSEKEIEETTSSGVVLVQNQSYYEVVLSNGESLYFSTFDEDGDLKGIATDEDSVEVVTNYGTGSLSLKLEKSRQTLMLCQTWLLTRM